MFTLGDSKIERSQGSNMTKGNIDTHMGKIMGIPRVLIFKTLQVRIGYGKYVLCPYLRAILPAILPGSKALPQEIL